MDVAEWIAEARCWVLRNRARLTRPEGLGGLGLFLLGHCHTCVSGCGGWLGPALTKPLVWVFSSGCVVSLVGDADSIGGGSGLVFLPVF